MFSIMTLNDYNINAFYATSGHNGAPFLVDAFCGLEFFAKICRANGVTSNSASSYEMLVRTQPLSLEGEQRVYALALIETDEESSKDGIIFFFEYPFEVSVIARYCRELGWTAIAGLLASKGETAVRRLETTTGLQELTEVTSVTDNTPETAFSGVLRTLGFDELATAVTDELEGLYLTLYPSGYGLVHDHFRQIRCMS